MDFEFLKDRYDFELDRKEMLTAALTLPVGVLSVLGGALTAMARSFTYSNQLVTGLFVVFVVSAVASFFACAYRLIRRVPRADVRLPAAVERIRAIPGGRPGVAVVC